MKILIKTEMDIKHDTENSIKQTELDLTVGSKLEEINLDPIKSVESKSSESKLDSTKSVESKPAELNSIESKQMYSDSPNLLLDIVTNKVNLLNMDKPTKASVKKPVLRAVCCPMHDNVGLRTSTGTGGSTGPKSAGPGSTGPEEEADLLVPGLPGPVLPGPVLPASEGLPAPVNIFVQDHMKLLEDLLLATKVVKSKVPAGMILYCKYKSEREEMYKSWLKCMYVNRDEELDKPNHLVPFSYKSYVLDFRTLLLLLPAKEKQLWVEGISTWQKFLSDPNVEEQVKKMAKSSSRMDTIMTKIKSDDMLAGFMKGINESMSGK